VSRSSFHFVCVYFRHLRFFMPSRSFPTFSACSHLFATLYLLSSVNYLRLPLAIASTSSCPEHLVLFLVSARCALRGTLYVHGVFNGMKFVLQSQPALHHQLLLGRVSLTKEFLSNITGPHHTNYISNLIGYAARRRAVLTVVREQAGHHRQRQNACLRPTVGNR